MCEQTPIYNGASLSPEVTVDNEGWSMNEKLLTISLTARSNTNLSLDPQKDIEIAEEGPRSGWVVKVSSSTPAFDYGLGGFDNVSNVLEGRFLDMFCLEKHPKADCTSDPDASELGEGDEDELSDEKDAFSTTSSRVSILDAREFLGELDDLEAARPVDVPRQTVPGNREGIWDDELPRPQQASRKIYSDWIAEAEDFESTVSSPIGTRYYGKPKRMSGLRESDDEE
ncbi:hypothetical protein F4778DRAFT_752926 [Xylariomycetidae sp. FL2044]|nr:hypothetical protein F4778DRAFT_752926 [Xylariomycetidae sp. FL2044]